MNNGLKDKISPIINLDPMILKDDAIQDLKRQRKVNAETLVTVQQLINMVNTDNESDYVIYQFLIKCRDQVQNKAVIITADLLDLLL